MKKAVADRSFEWSFSSAPISMDLVPSFQARLELGQDTPGKRPPLVDFTRVIRWVYYDDAYWTPDDPGRYLYVVDNVRLERRPGLLHAAWQTTAPAAGTEQ